MTMKELIHQKIDAYYTEYKAKFHQNGDSYHLGIIDGLDMAEQFLNTMPDELVTDCNDLEKAAKKSAVQYYVDGGYSPFPNTEMASHIAGFKAAAEWIAKQGVSYKATISADKTIPVLPMKDVSDMGLDYGDKVRIIIVKEGEE